MANRELVAGVDTYLLYGDEATYGTADTVDQHFGLVTSFKPSLNNNLIQSRGFTGSTSGGRNVPGANSRLHPENRPPDRRCNGWLQIS